jgi:flagellar hook-associated protein 2
VTASIINDGSATNPYRLVLTSDNAGSANSIIITQNDTTLDFANPIIEEAAAATGNTYAGTATSSGTYTGAASKRYVVEITTGGDLGTAKFRVSEDGGVTWSASDAFTTSATATEIFSGASGDGVDIAFSAGTFAVGDRFTIDAFAPEIQRPQDAVVRVDGITVTRDSNTVADVISGVTLNLSQTTSTPATISVSQDTQTIRGRIVTFVQQYNEVRNQIARYTAFDPETQVRGPLLGDLTVRTLQNTLANTVTSQVPGLSQSGINSLAGIGITVNSDGQLVVDDAKLDDALETNFATVKKLFALVGATTSSKLSYVDSTTATQPGTYAVNITAAAEQAAILSSQDITGPLGNAEVLTFTVGSDTHTVTVAAGSTLDQAVTSINSQLSDQGVAIEASRVGDKLRLATTDYGSAATITVKSDQSGASSTQLGIGTTDRTDSGVDVAGTIGGQSAKGVGQTLTANTGTKAEGLSVLVTATIPGLVGDITVSSGVAQQLAMTLESLTDAEDGSIAVRQKGLSDSIDQINDQIEKMQESISTEETRLRAQFASLETLLAQYNSTSSFLTNQLAQLAQLTTSR